MHESLTVVDGLQYANWDRSIFEQLIAGGVSGVHATIVYHETCRETLLRIGEWNRRFEAYPELIRPVNDMDDIRRAKAEGRVGVFFGAQNCSPIEDDIDLVAIFRRLGLLIMQLTYNNQSLLATGCYEAEDPGITRFGREVIREMNRVGMVIDMSHSGRRSTLEAIDISTRPIVISHANPLFFHDAKRNKSEQELRALADSGGLLGLSTYAMHLPGGDRCTLAEYCDMVARTVDLMGIEHVGVGTDLCQNQPSETLTWMRNGRWSRTLDFGEGSAAQPDWPSQPSWFRGAGDYPNLTAGLVERGFERHEIARIMGENWLDFLTEATRPQSS
ncbi:dipeptidase [Salinisphaera hydrothermalis]|uniref:dipeptidase n=1 Tax=Salinisphaera hydrothermalis TaxID=563188 RepID=UPI0033418AC7